MKLLLTSAGIKNESIKRALLELLDKPIEECHALCILPAIYTLNVGTQHTWNFFKGGFFYLGARWISLGSGRVYHP